MGKEFFFGIAIKMLQENTALSKRSSKSKFLLFCCSETCCIRVYIINEEYT